MTEVVDQVVGSQLLKVLSLLVEYLGRSVLIVDGSFELFNWQVVMEFLFGDFVVDQTNAKLLLVVAGGSA